MASMSCVVRKCSWSDLRSDMAKLSPELASIIDDISPSDEYSLYDISYEYGANIIDQQCSFIVPDKSSDTGYSKLTDSALSKEIIDDLNYNFNTHPVGMLMSGSLELFSQVNNSSGLFSIVSPGAIFGTWRLLDKGLSHCPVTHKWQLTSGSKSIFMLPKIGEQRGHNRVCKHINKRVLAPKNYSEQHELFKEIYYSCGEKKWQSRIIFFGKKWFESLDDKVWLPFKAYLLNLAWQGSGYWRNQYIWDVLFAHSEAVKRHKPDAKMASLVKNMLSIVVGAIPGYSPAQDDSQMPVSLISSIYKDIYKLESDAIIMQPSYFDLEDKKARPIYTSLQYTNMLNLLPSQIKSISTIKDMVILENLITDFVSEMRNTAKTEMDTSFGMLFDKVSLDLFHSAKDLYGNIKNNQIIVEDDKRFGNAATFPTYSTFLRGCIRISQ